MKVLKVRRRKINYKDYIKRTALESDAEILVDEDTVLYDIDDKEVKLIYKILPESDMHKQIFKGLVNVNYNFNKRVSGIKNLGGGKVIGYLPRMRMKPFSQTCKISKLATENKQLHDQLLEYAKEVNDIYEDNNQGRFLRHQSLIKKVNNNYIIPGTLFTSGIVNKNNPLKYHFDAGNFKKVSSAMIAFKHDIEGGHLCIPEYNVKLKIQNRSLSLFDGQEMLHGVTPIVKLSNQAMRFTIVYYSLTGMWACLPLDEEIANARNSRWESELKKYERKNK